MNFTLKYIIDFLRVFLDYFQNDHKLFNFFFKLDDNLTCTVCNRYLIKEKILQEKLNPPATAEFEPASQTLKEVLNTFKTAESSATEDESTNQNSNTADDTLSTISTHNTTATSILTEEETNNLGEKINNLLGNNKVTKVKLDEVSYECKRINNNLKLYLIVNVLNQSKESVNDEAEEGEEEDEPVCFFKLKYLFQDSSAENNRVIENCLCIFTRKSIVLFRVVNLDLFNENAEFDKCLKEEIVIKINQIETIEVGLGNNYLIIETNQNETTKTFKFFTMDIYQTSTFRNILLSIINLVSLCTYTSLSTIIYFLMLEIMNESSSSMILKNSRKNNQNTKSNLAKLLAESELSSSESADLDINIFTFIDELVISKNIL